MRANDNINFDYIRKALRLFVVDHKKGQCINLNELAEKTGLNSALFRNIISEWAKADPDRFFDYLGATQIKAATNLYRQSITERFDIKDGKSNIKNLITIEEFNQKDGEIRLKPNYYFYNTKFGKALIASTSKGLCYLAFGDNETELLDDLKNTYPHTEFYYQQDGIHHNALSFFDGGNQTSSLTLHIRGTEFQLKVWIALLMIPAGALATYGDIARFVGSPDASRAVGTAVGANPVSYLIPCHRVILSSGELGNYRWDPMRKHAMIAYEAAKSEKVL